MDDLISRQAAIDAIGKASDELYENIKKGATFLQRQWFDGMAQAQSILENLPSAQPEPCEDCVSRQAAIDAALSAFSRGLLASPDIRKLPSVQPERKHGEWTKEAHCPFCDFAPWYEKDIHTLSYCPNCGADLRAERRTDERTD